MASYPARALILTKTKLGEADLIFTLLAEDGRQIRAIAKGIRKPKAKMGGTLELFAACDLLLAKGRSLDIITEARTAYANEACSSDLEHSSAASAICELLARLSLEDQPQRRLFDMSLVALDVIGRTEPDRLALLVAAFNMKALSLLGYRPELRACVICGVDGDAALQYFSWSQGGVLCPDCSAQMDHPTDIPPALIAWMCALIYSTFEELLSIEQDPQISIRLLEFSRRWLIDNTDLNPKALGFFLKLAKSGL